ncbi:SDR family NAD(P)-dependent oxidoreductase [Actinosynnema sp. NPDC059335]|uniref:SDR family NAD(P)-dependent oxidoreductase n=1 Tax=Actinosynnema sp. NPDC059335 TaxID=3346804 RepID=UPI0036703FDD
MAALVTGAAGGIGLGIAQALVAEGARVALADRDEEELAGTVASLRDSGADVLAIALDVTDRAGWAAAAETVHSTWGPVSVLVNNAGVSSLGLGFDEVDATMWDRMVAVNLTGVYNGISTFYADLTGAGDAHIVNTASIGGLLGTARLAPYSATKAAVIALSEALRDEFAQAGVGVSVLCPGPVRSRLWRTSRSLRGLPDTDTPPTDLSGQSAHADMLPAEVGDLVVRGIHDNEPYIMTHDFTVILDVRDRALREAFTGTRTLDLPDSPP